MTQKQIRRLRLACYSANVTMSVTSCISPILFLTFRSQYKISFSMLGFLVLVNFFTQLLVDLALSFFSHRMDLAKTVKRIPVLALFGFAVYAGMPVLFSDYAFLGLCAGTVIFSFAAGLAEVLISPVIAAIPSPDPDREMSKLHSVYAWGCVAVVIPAAALLVLLGGKNWFWIPLIFSLLPAASAILFWGAEIPEMEKPARATGALKLLCSKRVLLSIACIFLGGASECTMAQWCSGYLEKAMGIPKFWGDLFGTALFSVALGLGRTLYAKRGRNIHRVLAFCFGGTALCYLVAALTPIPVVGLIACALTGLCASMLWPGNLVVAADRNPTAGVFIYAIMAAGGDLGASVGPQLMGVVADGVAASGKAAELCARFSLSPESLGMKAGMLVGMLFPLVGLCLTFALKEKSAEKKSLFERHPALLPLLCAYLGHIIWGVANVFTKTALEYTTPNVMLSMRFGLSAILMVFWMILRKRKFSLRGKKPGPALLLVSMQAAYYIFESYGIKYTNATVAGVVLAVVPVVAMVLAIFFLKEYPTRRQVIFSIFPTAGVIMMTLSASAIGAIKPIGILFLVLTCISSAIYKNANRSSSEDFDAFDRSFLVLAASAVVFTLWACLDGQTTVQSYFAPLKELPYLASILVLGLLCSLAANLLVNFAVARMQVVKLSSFGAISTLISMFSGVLFLHEPMNGWMFGGAVLILWGVYQVTRPATAAKIKEKSEDEKDV